MSEAYTVTQKHRLAELGANEECINQLFESAFNRDSFFKEMESELSKIGRAKLKKMLLEKQAPAIKRVENKLTNWLVTEEFTQVCTPTIISKVALEKMTIDEHHHLYEQVFWLDTKKCLRPMLAPNLYEVMRDIKKMTNESVRIFEVGSCFRKESQGAQHLNEFTMLNLVELATVKDGEQEKRLKLLMTKAMDAVGIKNFELKIDESTVYGNTVDIMVNDIEIASGAYGPHVLDGNWGIFDTWVGVGFGIERIAMVLENAHNIKSVGRSISYIDGVRI